MNDDFGTVLNEQRDIDIERAWNFIEKYCVVYDGVHEMDICVTNKADFLAYMKGDAK